MLHRNIRDLSVSLQGDGNGKTSKMSMVWPRKMPGLPDGYLARITRWLLPVQGKDCAGVREQASPKENAPALRTGARLTRPAASPQGVDGTSHGANLRMDCK